MAQPESIHFKNLTLLGKASEDLTPSGFFRLRPAPEFNANKMLRIWEWNSPKATNKQIICLHCFCYDYQFESLYTNAEKWAGILKQFNSVIAPDYSVYADFPESLQRFQKYKTMFVSRFLQTRGVRVIPCLQWGGKETFSWIFEGLPKNSVLAVSSVGSLRTSEKAFLAGLEEALFRLAPSALVWYGAVPKSAEELVKDIKIYRFFSEGTQFKKEFEYGRKRQQIQ